MAETVSGRQGRLSRGKVWRRLDAESRSEEHEPHRRLRHQGELTCQSEARSHQEVSEVNAADAGGRQLLLPGEVSMASL